MKLKKSKPRDPDYRDIEKEIQDVDDFDPQMVLIFYGPAGTGKTTAACTFPKPLLLVDISEEGTDSVRNVKGVKVIRIDPNDEEAWEKLEKIYWFLARGKHSFKTVVIDTVSGCQDLSMRRLLRDRGVEPEEGKLGNWGTMRKQDWGTIASDLKSIVFNFRSLRREEKIDALIFVAHDRINKEDEGSDDEGGITPQVEPRLMPSVVSTLNAAVGVIGHFFIREETKKIKIGNSVKKKRIVQYCMRLGPHTYYRTKIRKPKDTEAPPFIVNPDYQKILELVEGEED